VAKSYIPDAGDLVWIHFDPQAGHEQAGHRPALVVSSAAYNGVTGLMLFCPMTTEIKGYPFEVVIPGNPIGAVLADQVKSLDWRARKTVYKGKASASELRDVRAKIAALIESAGD